VKGAEHTKAADPAEGFSPGLALFSLAIFAAHALDAYWTL